VTFTTAGITANSFRGEECQIHYSAVVIPMMGVCVNHIEAYWMFMYFVYLLPKSILLGDILWLLQLAQYSKYFVEYCSSAGLS